MNGKLCITIACLIASVLGHAVLVDPVPFNQSPSKTSVCGVTPGTEGTYAATAEWFTNKPQIVTWRIVAGDGAGTVTVKVDQSGGADFADADTVTIMTDASPTQVQSYTMAIDSGALATVNCRATNGICIMQVAALSSAWYSCAAVNFSTCVGTCPTPTPAPPKCQNSGTLGFCTMKSNTGVYIAASDKVGQLDANAKSTFNSYLNNPKVFEVNNTLECRSAYQLFLCEEAFPPCPGADGTVSQGYVCDDICNAAMTQCSLNPLHKSLYDCTSYPACSKADCDKYKLDCSTNAGSTVVVSAFVAIIALIAALL